MATDPTWELPEEIRLEVRAVAQQKNIPVEWLVGLYRRGFNAKLGTTGRYPYGKIPGDDGELAAAIAADPRNGVVRMEFGTPVAWVAFPAKLARHFAKVLIEKADEVERKLS